MFGWLVMYCYHVGIDVLNHTGGAVGGGVVDGVSRRTLELGWAGFVGRRPRGKDTMDKDLGCRI